MWHLEAVWIFEEEIRGELSLNVTTFSRRNVMQPTSANVTTSRRPWDSPNENF